MVDPYVAKPKTEQNIGYVENQQCCIPMIFPPERERERGMSCSSRSLVNNGENECKQW